MDQIVLVVLLVLGLPIIVGIWLIVRAISARDQLETLTRRVDELHLELAKLKREGGAAPKKTEEKIADFIAADLPPLKEPAPATPPPIPPQYPASAPVAEPVIPPLTEPVGPGLFATSVEVEPEAASQPPPFIPAPPVIPPPFVPKPAWPPKPEPEPVLERGIHAASAPLGKEASERPEDLAPNTSSASTEKSSFEMQVGTYWLVRIGIVILVTGLAFGANLAYHNIVPKLGPGEKISLLYLASGLLLAAGAWWQRRNVKESLKNYAQVLFAGGLAAVYFTTFAAHYAPPVCIIESPLVDGILLFVWAGVIAWIADRQKSEVMALFAVGLAFFTSVMTRVGEFTLYSNLLLTIAAVIFLVRNRWATLSFASLITSYAGYAFWRFLHDNGWHWAMPGENLWLGAGFLASYWTVFTAATFLSKSERLSGASRAAFLTLNNGAFFALFLLTMLQVHTGGFWKFSLIYGSVLLACAGMARYFLPSEPLTKNSYLTHGLVLVTLGFISKFAGLKLALVLGAESVVLYVLSTQRQSAILKFFAYTAALLATGWCAATFENFNPQDLWMGIGLGALLAFNAGWAQRTETKTIAEPTRLEPSVFTLLAFGCWTLATWSNTAEPHILVAVILGLESIVFYNVIGGRTIAAPKVFAYIAAAASVGWCIAGLKRDDVLGLWIGIASGAFMLFNAWRAHQLAKDSSEPLRAEPTAFTLFAFAAWLATTWYNSTLEHLPLVLAVEAVALTFSIYLLRIREVSLLGQFFLIFAQLVWLFHFLNVTPPWWNPLLIIAVTVGLSHWWQHQKAITVSQNIFVCYSTIFALAAVAVALAWLHPLMSPPAWLAVTSLLAVAVTIYGVASRAWALAICGQLFLAVSAWEFLRQLFENKPEWYYPLAPLVVLAGLSFATLAWFARKPESNAAVRAPLLQVAMIYRWLALILSLYWVWDYVPERERVWAFMLAATAVFAIALMRNSREALIATATYATASLALMWLRDNLEMDIYGPNLISLLTLFAMQQILRRRAQTLPSDETIHGAIVITAGLTLWRFLSCWTSQFNAGLSVTMTWAGFALVMFTAGMLLRERFLRWFGLGVLATSVGRIVLVDVWKQETGYRVLTFIALGVALLVVGFIYNKYQEKIRQWL